MPWVSSGVARPKLLALGTAARDALGVVDARNTNNNSRRHRRHGRLQHHGSTRCAPSAYITGAAANQRMFLTSVSHERFSRALLMSVFISVSVVPARKCSVRFRRGFRVFRGYGCSGLGTVSHHFRVRWQREASRAAGPNKDVRPGSSRTDLSDRPASSAALLPLRLCVKLLIFGSENDPSVAAAPSG